MKSIKTTLFAVLIVIGANSTAQNNTTLQNLLPSTTRIATKYTGSSWGYWTGHNSKTRDAYAEKYYIKGSGKVLGVISELIGNVRPTSTKEVKFEVISVNKKGLPSTTSISSTNVVVTKLELKGKPTTIMFKTPTAVADSFFVGIKFWDYAHETLRDTIAVLHGADGCRPDSDLKLIGRNAVLPHSHAANPPWSDFYTQNFTKIKTHLALFPIMEGIISGVTDFETDEFKINSIYPNPFVEKINISINRLNKSDIRVIVYDTQGKIVAANVYNASSIVNDNIEITCPATLPAGTYVLFIQGDQTGAGFSVIKN